MSLQILTNVNLAQYTSWLVGGSAEYFALPETLEDVQQALEFKNKNSLPLTIIGSGSNVLISDHGVKGLVLCLRRFSGLNSQIKDNRLVIEALAGTGKSDLLKVFLKYKLAPALFLAGLPGDMGGGVVMNAGVAEAFNPREFMELVDWIEVLTDTYQILRIPKEQLNYSYRHTTGFQPHLIIKVGLSWPLEPDEQVLTKVRDANRARLSKQPLDMPSCGSVFKNPETAKAAQLIDQAGLKGFQIGGAQVSLKHANFIVNLGQASAFDIWQVILHVQKTVENTTGIRLSTEVVRLGIWN